MRDGGPGPRLSCRPHLAQVATLYPLSVAACLSANHSHLLGAVIHVAYLRNYMIMLGICEIAGQNA